MKNHQHWVHQPHPWAGADGADGAEGAGAGAGSPMSSKLAFNGDESMAVAMGGPDDGIGEKWTNGSLEIW